MNIGIYNPYLDTISGGERYTSTLANHWANKHAVTIFWNDITIKEKLFARLGIDLSKVSVKENIFISKNLIAKAFELKQYDILFFLSDGSVPTSFAKRTILHFQVPFPIIHTSEYKQRRINSVICNSNFTKINLDQNFGFHAKVIYPPVNVCEIKSKRKQKIILSVGRFSSGYTAKKHEVLIDAFQIARVRGYLKDWKLIIAGGLLPIDEDYFRALQKRVIGLPITLLPNVSREILLDTYARASFYWHAAGFGETNPQHMEHFGISTVEAMAAGCIPIVVKQGGLPEIIRHGENGFLWASVDELITYTTQLLGKEKKNITIREKAKKRAWDFDVSVFTQAFDDILFSYETDT